MKLFLLLITMVFSFGCETNYIAPESTTSRNEPVFLDEGYQGAAGVTRRSRELLGDTPPPREWIQGPRPFVGVDLRDANECFGRGAYDITDPTLQRRIEEDC